MIFKEYLIKEIRERLNIYLKNIIFGKNLITITFKNKKESILVIITVELYEKYFDYYIEKTKFKHITDIASKNLSYNIDSIKLLINSISDNLEL